MYSQGVTGPNYLHSAQVADANGRVNFMTGFPGCYSGRWPHTHFEIFASLDNATNGHDAGRISQLAPPKAACSEACALYPNSTSNLNRITLKSDNVLGDGGVHRIAMTSGNFTDGHTAFPEACLAVEQRRPT